ncbi:MAG: DNA polymerase subunit beta [Gloeocapsa sp. DLM2.Bin57]|nr:MAG: DNA polymerase subunit beta [Gloeocapsa sp. DLM2.Bin57]
MNLKQLLEEKRKDIIEIAARHGAYNIRIFGSVARGEDNENSDFDFLIDDDLDKISPWFPGGLLVDLEDLLERKVDIVTEKGLSDLIRQQILTEAIPL